METQTHRGSGPVHEAGSLSGKGRRERPLGGGEDDLDVDRDPRFS